MYVRKLLCKSAESQAVKYGIIGLQYIVAWLLNGRFSMFVAQITAKGHMRAETQRTVAIKHHSMCSLYMHDFRSDDLMKWHSRRGHFSDSLTSHQETDSSAHFDQLIKNTPGEFELAVRSAQPLSPSLLFSKTTSPRVFLSTV